jgi:hypothetical protein
MYFSPRFLWTLLPKPDVLDCSQTVANEMEIGGFYRTPVEKSDPPEIVVNGSPETNLDTPGYERKMGRF